MAKIYNILTGQGIIIPDELILRNDDYVSIEIGGSFNWGHHKETCKECHSFGSSFGSDTRKWFIDLFGETKIIDLSTFGKPNDYQANLYIFNNAPEFWGSKLKFKIDSPNKDELIQKREDKVNEENYESACEIRDIINKLNNKHGGYIK